MLLYTRIYSEIVIISCLTTSWSTSTVTSSLITAMSASVWTSWPHLAFLTLLLLANTIRGIRLTGSASPTGSRNRNCSSERTKLLAGGGRQDVYIPTCHPNGSYTAVQCYRAATAYCWCVTPDGKPIPRTSVKESTPNCNQGGFTCRYRGIWC